MVRYLQVGDFLPDLVLEGNDVMIHSASLGGHPWCLWIYPSLDAYIARPTEVSEAAGVLNEKIRLIEAYLCAAEDQKKRTISEIPLSIEERRLMNLLGDNLSAARAGVLLTLASDLKILDITNFTDARCVYESAIASASVALGALDDGSEVIPMLRITNALSVHFCQRLVQIYSDSNNKIQGRVGLSEPKTDLQTKRATHVNVDRNLACAIDRQLLFSTFPAIERVYDFRVTHRVAYKITCYDSAQHGYFRAHRDNSDSGTQYRRFGFSLCLNDEWDGGGISFPEYSRRRLRTKTGDALIFPASLLHEVKPIAAGKRFVLLSFFYDEASAQHRRASMANPSVLDGPFNDRVDEQLLALYNNIYAPQSRFSPQY